MGKTIKGQQMTRRTLLAAGVAVVMTPFISARAGSREWGVASGEMMPRAPRPGASDFTGNYDYGGTGNPRQVLDLYRAASATVSRPGPIYIWAHPNGNTYRTNLPSGSIRRQLHEQGISIISWESYPNLNQANEPEVTADAYLMLRWVRNNAARLGLDANRIVLGGASRGTFASWRIGHDPAHASYIKGMFMRGALPGTVNSTKPPHQPAPYTISGRSPSYWIAATSPTIKFLHVPISQDRFHCEYNSTPVMQAYTAKGIGSKTSRHIVPSTGAMDDYLVDFVAACVNA